MTNTQMTVSQTINLYGEEDGLVIYVDEYGDWSDAPTHPESGTKCVRVIGHALYVGGTLEDACERLRDEYVRHTDAARIAARPERFEHEGKGFGSAMFGGCSDAFEPSVAKVIADLDK